MALYELLIVIASLAGTVLGLTQVALSTSQVRRANLEKMTADQAVDEQVQAVSATPFSDIIATHDGRNFDVGLSGEANPMLRPLDGDPDGMPGSITVLVPDPPGDPTKLLEIIVRVDWVGTHGPQSLARTIRISRLGAVQ